jgi:hypothetical protein
MISSPRAAALAPAGVGLAMFVTAVEFRMDEPWADGVLFVAAAVPAALLVALGLLAARADGARAAATMHLVGGLVLCVSAITWLGQILAGEEPTEGGGTFTWMLLLFTAIAAYCWARTRAVACLLIAALASVATVAEAVNWIFDTDNLDTFRAVLTVCFVVLLLAGITASGRTGTILVGAAGVTALVFGYFLGVLFFSAEADGLGWGWELVSLLEGLALLAYAVVELEPGPAYLAFFVLGVFTIGASASFGGVLVGPESGEDSHTLVGWPLALGVGTVLAALWGLRRAADA